MVITMFDDTNHFEYVFGVQFTVCVTATVTVTVIVFVFLCYFNTHIYSESRFDV